MKFTYPAIVRKTDEGSYTGFMPDLPGCEGTADTLDELMEKLNEAMVNCLDAEFLEEDPQLPPITDVEDLSLKEGEFARQVCATIRFHTGWDE